MKQTTFLSVAFAICIALASAAQEKPNDAAVLKTSNNPLFILKVDKRCLEIDTNEDKEFKIDSIDPNTIKSIDVIKEKSKTTELYGLKAHYGVVIIYLKESDSLPKELQTKFVECK